MPSIQSTLKSRQEKLLQNITQDFDFTGINKSPSRFNLKKLQDINSQFIRMMTLEEFVLRSHLIKDKVSINHNLEIIDTSPFCYKLEMAKRNNLTLPIESKDIILQYCAWYLDKNRITVLSEFGAESGCILNWQNPELEDVKWKKSSVQDSLSNLIEIKNIIIDLAQKNPHNFPNRIDQIEHYMKESTLWWETEIKNWLESMGYAAGDYLWPLRVTLSGQTKSPSPFEILSILSEDEVIRRIDCVCNRQ